MRKVILVFRKPYPSSRSIEYLFHSIYASIKNKLLIKEYELPHFSIGFWNRLYNLFLMVRFRKCIVHITGDTYYAILGALFCKRIITIHDLSFLTRTKGVKRKVLKLFWVTLPVKFSHQVTVVSKATEDILLKETNVRKDKITVIYNFIDPIYQPVIRNFNTCCPRILQIGTAFNKNINNLAKALEGLNCILVIVGHLSNEQKKVLLVSKINYINKYSLSVEELYNEYKRADMLSFISTVEGFGMPILEAQATGLPVITSSCSSMPEIAGDGALLVNPFDPQNIQMGIIEIVFNEAKREELVKEGYINVKRFSKEKIAADYLKVYQDL